MQPIRSSATRRRTIVVFLIGSVALSCALGILVFSKRPSKDSVEPVYNGKTFSKILASSMIWDRLRRDWKIQTQTDFGSAILTLGTNALPSLLKGIERSDGRFVSFTRKHTWLQNEKFLALLAATGCFDAARDRKAAVNGFAILGYEARVAIPALINIEARNEEPPGITPRQRTEVLDVIDKIGESALPDLEQLVTKADPRVRRAATYALGYSSSFESMPREAASIMLRCFRDTDWGVHNTAFTYLSIHPEYVKEIVPALRDISDDVHSQFRSHAQALIRLSSR